MHWTAAMTHHYADSHLSSPPPAAGNWPDPPSWSLVEAMRILLMLPIHFCIWPIALPADNQYIPLRGPISRLACFRPCVEQWAPSGSQPSQEHDCRSAYFPQLGTSPEQGISRNWDGKKWNVKGSAAVSTPSAQVSVGG